MKHADRVEVGLPAYEDLLAKLMLEFVAHAEAEERDVLPLLEEHVTKEELHRLGERFEQAGTLVTTRPHPLAPSEGAAAVAAHLATKPLDALRDKLSGRDEVVHEEDARVMADAEKSLHMDEGDQRPAKEQVARAQEVDDATIRRMQEKRLEEIYPPGQP